MSSVKTMFLVALVAMSQSYEAKACGGGQVVVRARGCSGCHGVQGAVGGFVGGHAIAGGAMGGGYVASGNPYYRFPGVGGGQVAFRRARRLARRSRRAAWFGFYGRANRLAFRSIAAYHRGAFRSGWF